MEQNPYNPCILNRLRSLRPHRPAAGLRRAAVHKTTIGGQAVIEGVMMRGPEKDLRRRP